MNIDGFAKRFATMVDAEVQQYEAKAGKKASDYVRRKFRNAALTKLNGKWNEEVTAVLGFLEYLTTNAQGRDFGSTSYPSYDSIPPQYMAGAEIYAIYRGALASRTRYRNEGMDAYRAPKKKKGNTTMISHEATPASQSTTKAEKVEARNASKEKYISLLAEIGDDTLALWREEYHRQHRLGKLIAALSPEDMEALTDLLTPK